MRRITMRLARSPRRRQDGMAAIEFAIILPVFLFILLGGIEYGWFFYINLAATNAAREGARIATTYTGACPNATATSAGHDGAINYLKTLSIDKYATVSSTCTTLTGIT